MQQSIQQQLEQLGNRLERRLDRTDARMVNTHIRSDNRETGDLRPLRKYVSALLYQPCGTKLDFTRLQAMAVI